MTMSLVISKTTNGVCHVELNRPEKRNALCFDLLGELATEIQRAQNDPATSVLLMTARGPAFCSGMDLKAVDLTDRGIAQQFGDALAEVYQRLLGLDVPLVAAVDGPALGGGLGLAVAADFVFAGGKARFALPETRLGLVPALVSVVARRRLTLQRLVAVTVCDALFDAREAVASGLADVYTEDAGSAAAIEHSQRLAQERSSAAAQRTKRFLRQFEPDVVSQQLSRASAEFVAAVAMPEAQRGLAAFRRGETVSWCANTGQE